MILNPKEAPPGFEAVPRVGAVYERGCLEHGGCAFLEECAPRDRSLDCPVLPVSGNGIGCRPGDRKDDCRALFKRISYGNEEED